MFLPQILKLKKPLAARLQCRVWTKYLTLLYPISGLLRCVDLTPGYQLLNFKILKCYPTPRFFTYAASSRLLKALKKTRPSLLCHTVSTLTVASFRTWRGSATFRCTGLDLENSFIAFTNKKLFCGAEGSRTPDLQSAILALSQLSYCPAFSSASSATFQRSGKNEGFSEFP